MLSSGTQPTPAYRDRPYSSGQAEGRGQRAEGRGQDPPRERLAGIAAPAGQGESKPELAGGSAGYPPLRAVANSEGIPCLSQRRLPAHARTPWARVSTGSYPSRLTTTEAARQTLARPTDSARHGRWRAKRALPPYSTDKHTARQWETGRCRETSNQPDTDSKSLQTHYIKVDLGKSKSPHHRNSLSTRGDQGPGYRPHTPHAS